MKVLDASNLNTEQIADYRGGQGDLLSQLQGKVEHALARQDSVQSAGRVSAEEVRGLVAGISSRPIAGANHNIIV
jgi:hypothetical protein